MKIVWRYRNYRDKTRIGQASNSAILERRGAWGPEVELRGSARLKPSLISSYSTKQGVLDLASKARQMLEVAPICMSSLPFDPELPSCMGTEKITNVADDHVTKATSRRLDSDCDPQVPKAAQMPEFGIVHEREQSKLLSSTPALGDLEEAASRVTTRFPQYEQEAIHADEMVAPTYSTQTHRVSAANSVRNVILLRRAAADNSADLESSADAFRLRAARRVSIFNPDFREVTVRSESALVGAINLRTAFSLPELRKHSFG
nr:hypothetical protein CFP56_24274 [Quercus suber]